MTRNFAARILFGFLLSAGILVLPGMIHGVEAAPPATAPPPPAAHGPGGSPQAVPSGSWQAQVQKRIQEAEYEITWQSTTLVRGLPAAWHAPNRAHNFRTYFTEEGIRVIPRTEPIGPGAAPSWEWSLALAAYGRSGRSWPVPEAGLSAAGNRMEYRRGALTEWYVNGPRGLKQGFELPSPPEEFSGSSGQARPGRRSAVPGRGRDIDPEGLIHLDLALGGDLRPAIAANGQAVDFRTPSGARAVHYAELRVEDATGRKLPAWMEGVASAGFRGIRIVVDTAEAVYPVTIDPLATSPAWMAESDQATAFFGYSVSTAGDIDGDGFSDIIVGAYSYDNGHSNEGAAFVYRGSSSGIDPNWSWSAEGNQDGAGFGFSVSTAGDVDGDGFADVIVGAYHYDNGQTSEGAAFVYHGSASGLDLSPGWSAESDQADANFGFSVSTAGDVDGDGFSDVIVGSSFYDNGQSDEGASFVYHGSASGLDPNASWIREGEQDNAHFGHSVSTAGDVDGDGFADVIVGSYSYSNGETFEGSAFVYHGSAAGLDPNASWIAESNQANASFGRTVSTAGDIDGDGFADVIVGAYNYDNGQANEGSAFVYRGSSSGLDPNWSWSAESDQASASFGWSVSTAGDVDGDGLSDVIIGAYAYDNGQSYEGAAFVYHGSVSGLATSAGWSAESDQADAYFGRSVSTAGDVNGDGFADVIVGASQYDNGQTEEGAAFVYHGSASGLDPNWSWMAEGDQAYAYFGLSVSTAGDVNGDGFSDVIVGTNFYDNGEIDEGVAFVYHGSASGLGTSPGWSAEGNQASDYYGQSVSTAGDVNGDGFSDVIVGAFTYDNGDVNEGAVFVYHGSASGLDPNATWMAESNQAGSAFGRSVSTAGDVDGDGFSDVIIGADLYDNGQTNEGASFVYHGSASGLDPNWSWMAESDQGDAYFGQSVSTAGDVDGDGFSDVIVGSYYYDNGQANEGVAFVYHGSASGLDPSPGWSAESDQSGASFGISVSTAGDVDGDGFSDVIVGSSYYDNGQSNEGATFVYHGSASGLDLSPGWSAESNQTGASFGNSVSTAGDVNGDGFADVIVGAASYDNGESTEGTVFVYQGNGGGGLSLRPQQRRTDDAAPISLGLRSRAPGSFRLAALGRTPFGRGRVKLQWEVEPRNHFFDGTGTQQGSAWTDTGTAGAALDEVVSSLEPDGYHWRVRLLFDPATSPFQTASRWFTVPSNGWHETDIVLGAFIGGAVWEDRDGDGIRDASEPPLASVLVYLLDASLTPIDAALTASDGSYRFELPGAGPHAIRVTIPSGYFPTLQDQGSDDTLDSDVDVLSGETPMIGAPYQAFDATGWSAGLRLIGPCTPPDEPLFVYNTRLGPANETILDFQDFNQPGQVTGYNVYRSSDPAPAPGTWPLFATDVVDGDAGTVNIQWADTSLDVPPGGIWYYEVAAYNSACGAEGPF